MLLIFIHREIRKSCRYAAHDALDIVGKGFLACSEIAEHYFECWNIELERAAGSEPCCATSSGGCLQLKRGVLNTRIGKPLGELFMFRGGHSKLAQC